MSKTIFVAWFVSIWVGCLCLAVPKAQREPEPTSQSHTLHKDVVAQAILQPLGGSAITGNVEFQRKEKGVLVLAALANATRENKLLVKLVDLRHCPGGEAPSAPRRSGAPLVELVTVPIVKEGKGTAQKHLTQFDLDNNLDLLVNHAVVVEEPGKSPRGYLSCGIVHSNAPSQGSHRMAE